METVLEQQRRYHEERERLVNELTKEMLYNGATHKEKLNSEFRVRLMYDVSFTFSVPTALLQRYLELTRELRDLYDDKDGMRKMDIQALSGPNEFNEFYDRLKQIKDFHRKHPDEICVPMSTEFEKYKEMREKPEEANATLIEFSDEEGYGRFLDLHDIYKKYLNVKGVPRIDYLTYISFFDRLYDIARDKKGIAYKAYLEDLLAYLEDFLSRARPIVDLDEETKDALAKFETEWVQGTFPGWGREAAPALSHGGAHLDLTAFTTWEELASLGLDRLKSALLALGLKCGGTLEERAKRLWSTKGKALEELPAEMFVTKQRATKGFAKTAAWGHMPAALSEKHRQVAVLEARIYRLSELLKEIREATIENVQRRQARVGFERDEDEADADKAGNADGSGNAGGDDEEDDIPYNPKNLPLGWDGKPIPYWLYKLHGLNMYYSCEICGNVTYRGPKAFQQHFSEWRHAHGMRCLGIPNTIHFAHVTKIEDALALWQRIRTMKESERWRPDVEEELEDNSGNVVSRKTYEDLKRQGLL
ncbi:splicing factor 3A subunit 3 [Clonorchis sinensis]|uniref:Splicing factor 3A subunit 3 n=1 Tax=Clonorchis sinensis TaxID=79923 RepID=G7YTU0_CLOSI|nr:splicing factor 3A subunit 3 [Clonorchis sinensis]